MITDSRPLLWTGSGVEYNKTIFSPDQYITSTRGHFLFTRDRPARTITADEANIRQLSYLDRVLLRGFSHVFFPPNRPPDFVAVVFSFFFFFIPHEAYYFRTHIGIPQEYRVPSRFYFFLFFYAPLSVPRESRLHDRKSRFVYFQMCIIRYHTYRRYCLARG